jgi:hypothetical protein
MSNSPTTIFTFGILFWTDRRAPLYLLAIPLAWSFMGFWAAVSLGMAEDFGLLVAGVIASLIIILGDRRRDKSRIRKDESGVVGVTDVLRLR